MNGHNSYNSAECAETLLEMRILIRQAIAVLEYKRWLAQQKRGGGAEK